MITIGLLFWLLLIFALIFGWLAYPPAPNWRPFGYSLLLWILLALLGLGTFGVPVRL